MYPLKMWSLKKMKNTSAVKEKINSRRANEIQLKKKTKMGKQFSDENGIFIKQFTTNQVYIYDGKMSILKQIECLHSGTM